MCANLGAIGAIAQKNYLRKLDACVDVCGRFAQKYCILEDKNVGFAKKTLNFYFLQIRRIRWCVRGGSTKKIKR